VDGEGNVIVATLVNGGVTSISANGAMTHTPCPDILTTNACFAAPTSAPLRHPQHHRPAHRLRQLAHEGLELNLTPIRSLSREVGRGAGWGSGHANPHPQLLTRTHSSVPAVGAARVSKRFPPSRTMLRGPVHSLPRSRERGRGRALRAAVTADTVIRDATPRTPQGRFFALTHGAPFDSLPLQIPKPTQTVQPRLGMSILHMRTVRAARPALGERPVQCPKRSTSSTPRCATASSPPASPSLP
jgi:hypothetical protein